ncbi:MAG: SBBP repeat-containing protein, partial [Planctomycetes bacterium]|nr:SBBP repeat-containing protein [Planctomycetota bacterium]
MTTKHRTALGGRPHVKRAVARLAGALLPLVLAYPASAELIPEWDALHAGVDGFYFGFKVPVGVVTDSEGAVYVNSTIGLGLADRDILTVKYAPDGTLVWSVTYDGPSQNVDIGKGITIDSAGDILVLGQSQGVFLVIKYDASDGSIIGTMQHDPGGSVDIPNALTTDDAGNIYVTGQSWVDQRDFYTFKMDSLGNVLWTARYNGPGPFLFAHDIAVDIALDSNGDIFVTGPSNSATAFPDFATIKYRGSDGAQLWLDRYHSSTDIAVDLIIDSQDNVYVTGFTEGQFHHITTIKYRNSDGARLWVALDTPAAQNFATSLALDSRGDVYVA